MTVSEAALVESLETGLRIALGSLTGDASKLEHWRQCAHETLLRRGWTAQQVEEFVAAVEHHHDAQARYDAELSGAQQQVRDAWRDRRETAHAALVRARAASRQRRWKGVPMPEHFRHEYQDAGDGRVCAACICGWRSDPITPSRRPVGLLTDAALDHLDDLWRQHVAPLITPSADEVLEQGEGGRYWLAGAPLSTGTPLGLLMPGGVWIIGRLEVEHGTPGPWGMNRDPLPIFYASVGGPADDNDVVEYVEQVHFPLPPRAVLRRPSRR